jgi:thioredoxin 1
LDCAPAGDPDVRSRGWRGKLIDEWPDRETNANFLRIFARIEHEPRGERYRGTATLPGTARSNRMINRRAFVSVMANVMAAASVLAGGGVAAKAAAVAAFDAKAFGASQSDGKTILVEITAPWCPVCKAQKPILQGLWSRPEFKDYTVFDVDFDTQKSVVRSFHATSQSTLIVFKGKTEIGRSVGDTDAASIEALLKKAV